MATRGYSCGALAMAKAADCFTYDVIIIGTGIAGLSTALSLDKRLRVALISKNALTESSTYKAQGGMAVAAGSDDSAARHAADTLRVGKGLCVQENVEHLTQEAMAALQFLQAAGTDFCCDGQGLQLTREGGHSRNRVAHHHDYTGRHIAEALMNRAAGRPQLDFFNNTFLVDLLTDTQGICCGCLVQTEQAALQLLAPAVVVAAGGYSGIFARSTNAATASGDGIAAAYRAGAVIADMEFVQFHPTAVTLPSGKVFLLSEALRGEGAVLRNTAGERFMPRYHEDGELAPRDEVSRAMLAEMKRRQAPVIYLDARALPSEQLTEHFRSIYGELAAHGYCLERDVIPVQPTAHYTIGGIKTDAWGQTSVPSLYACGESAATGVHGANRLASNSLLEGVVFGRRVAACINDNCHLPPGKPDLSDAGLPVYHRGIDTALLRARLDQAAGVIRQGEELARLAEWLYSCRETGEQVWQQADCCRENAALVAELLLEAAFVRQESRGGHYRADFPATNDSRFKKHSEQLWGRKVRMQ